MKFGGFVPQGWRMDLVGVDVDRQWPAMVDVAQRLESAGYESLWLYDHFHTVPEQTQESTFECWSLMAALAPVTDTIRLGQMCTCNSYRLPSYMAKVASSVDVISGGRVEFAIGAGWYEEEYLAYGYEFPKPSVRIGQLEEAVQIIKAMWTQDEAFFEGQHYRVDGAINRPKPLQDPHPPMWIAGGGEQLTLRVVAEHADYANFAQDLDTFNRKSEILERHCEAVGREFSEIGRTVHLEALMAGSDAELREKAERVAAAQGRTADAVLERSLNGSVDEVTHRLGEFAEAGCVYVIAYFPDAVWGDSPERMAEVAKSFR